MNNGDLISREALIERLERNLNACNPNTFSELCFQDAINTVKNFPAVDAVEVVHGRWIRPTKISGKNFDIPHCSVCHEVPCGADGNYCPNCGARMDGE